ncbi:unnamed protein product [Lampetra planeri]
MGSFHRSLRSCREELSTTLVLISSSKSRDFESQDEVPHRAFRNDATLRRRAPCMGGYGDGRITPPMSKMTALTLLAPWLHRGLSSRMAHGGNGGNCSSERRRGLRQRLREFQPNILIGGGGGNKEPNWSPA